MGGRYDKINQDEHGYNGWSNYPTWCVNLWLSNDEGLFEQTRHVVREAIANPYEFRPTNDLERGGEVATALQRLVEDLAPDLGSSFGADLLGYAIAQVDWWELAKAWIEDVAEVEA